MPLRGDPPLGLSSAEGEEVIEGLSLSIFTVEADRKPIVSVQFRKHAEAEVLLLDEVLLEQLRKARSAGVPILDDFSVLRVRLARENERAVYFDNVSSLLAGNGEPAVLLVELDATS